MTSAFREAAQKLQSRGVEVNYNTDRPEYLQHGLVFPMEDLPMESLIARIWKLPLPPLCTCHLNWLHLYWAGCLNLVLVPDSHLVLRLVWLKLFPHQSSDLFKRGYWALPKLVPSKWSCSLVSRLSHKRQKLRGAGNGSHHRGLPPVGVARVWPVRSRLVKVISNELHVHAVMRSAGARHPFQPAGV